MWSSGRKNFRCGPHVACDPQKRSLWATCGLLFAKTFVVSHMWPAGLMTSLCHRNSEVMNNNCLLMKPLASNFDFSGLQRVHECSESPPRDAILRNHFGRSVKVQAIQAAGGPPVIPPSARSRIIVI
ncbi:hypothetical protein AVEN_176555-1 [Araneus ventricosus]|uniref:Uncharacterized protein n=1 Tax=Araneus ventricosus TaxID=182803 RepID=A0A4Y2URM3_ARAVE|nr:hypothetical protein AVEN_176555-1 [Araneus ventricosus]